MADKLLLPGYGGLYTSESFTSSSTTGADTIDCSRCRQVAVQVSSTGSPGGNFDIQQTFNGSDWAAFVSNVAVTDGTVSLIDEADGPFGKIRLDMTDVTSGTDETLVVTLVGFE